MSQMVYVVIAEEGEYSDRRDWVAGVFTDKAEAEQRVLDHTKEVHTWSVLYEAWVSERRRLFTLVQPRLQAAINEGLPVDKYDAFRDDILAEAGPCPEYKFPFDRLYFVEVPLDVWGTFEFAGGKL